MQIGPSNSLTFIGASAPGGTGRAGDTDSQAASAKSASQEATAPAVAAPQPEPGVVVNVQAQAPDGSPASLPQDLVYTDSTQGSAAGSSDVSDTERMAQQHSQAVLRNAGTTTSLSVDKDGVLIAKPASAQEIKAQQFVYHAVAAMRSYADEQDRLKTASQAVNGNADAKLIPRSLAEVQKLAARFKLFT